MRNYLVPAISLFIFASCSTSNKTYRDYNNSQYSRVENKSSGGAQNVDKYPLHVNPSLYTAGSTNSFLPLVYIKDTATKEEGTAERTGVNDVLSAAEVTRRTRELSKIQRKEFRKAMRESMRRYLMPASKKETKDRDKEG